VLFAITAIFQIIPDLLSFAGGGPVFHWHQNCSLGWP